MTRAEVEEKIAEILDPKNITSTHWSYCVISDIIESDDIASERRIDDAWRLDAIRRVVKKCHTA